MQSPPLLSVRNLRTELTHAGRVLPVVNGVSFDLGAGESLGIVGESGSGKTMMALSLMRMIAPPGRIAGGEILLGGRDLLPLDKRAMRSVRGREMAMVFQDTMSSLNPTMRVGDQVGEPLRWHGLARGRAADERVLELLRRVGIRDAETRFWDYPFQFSGGMRQRVMIAMAIACNPQLLIADEPTSALDVTVQKQILTLLRDLRREQGTAIAMITHDLGVVAEVCDRVAVMYAGRLVEQAPTHVFMRGPAHPYAQKLLLSTPQLGRRGEPLDPILGQPPDLRKRPSGCAFHPRCAACMPLCERVAPPQVELGPGQNVACWLHVPEMERPT